MQLSYIEAFTKLRQAWEVIDALLLRAPDARGRCALLAEMLQFLWPGEALSACVLREADGAWAAALDEAGDQRPKWAALIRDELTRRWTAADATAVRIPLLQALGLTGLVLAREDVRVRDKVYGSLLLAVPEDDGSNAEAVRALLAACAQHLALRLEVEDSERRWATWAAEQAGDLGMAEVGEVSIPVTHEFNNFLNALLLHTAVLKYQLPESVYQGLEELRRQATAAAGLIQQVQHYRRRQQPPRLPVDVDRAVWAAVEALGGKPSERGGVREYVRLESLTYGTVEVAVHLDLGAGETPAPATFAEMKRLCVFLIRNAAAAAATNKGAVVVRTAREGERVILRVEDTGPAIPAEMLPHLFEPASVGREGTSALELAACKTLARRLQGGLRAENLDEGGAAFVVEWERPE